MKIHLTWNVTTFGTKCNFHYITCQVFKCYKLYRTLMIPVFIFMQVCCPSQQSGGDQTPSGPPARNNLIPQLNDCGKSYEDKIVGGRKTEIDEFPWMALLRYSKRKLLVCVYVHIIHIYIRVVCM